MADNKHYYKLAKELFITMSEKQLPQEIKLKIVDLFDAFKLETSKAIYIELEKLNNMVYHKARFEINLFIYKMAMFVIMVGFVIMVISFIYNKTRYEINGNYCYSICVNIGGCICMIGFVALLCIGI